jgi:hypothetical protein
VVDLYAELRYKSSMGVPRKLSERQMKFAELLVYNEGRMSPAECAKEAGYETRPRQAASELRSPKISPLVVRYIGELRSEVQEKYGISIERHLTELAKLRDDAQKKGAWSAAINAEVARGKAGGLYVDQKLIMTGSIDQLSEQELEARMKDILKDHKDIIEGTAVDVVQETIIEDTIIEEEPGAVVKPKNIKKLN